MPLLGGGARVVSGDGRRQGCVRGRAGTGGDRGRMRQPRPRPGSRYRGRPPAPGLSLEKSPRPWHIDVAAGARGGWVGAVTAVRAGHVEARVTDDVRFSVDTRK